MSTFVIGLIVVVVSVVGVVFVAQADVVQRATEPDGADGGDTGREDIRATRAGPMAPATDASAPVPADAVPGRPLRFAVPVALDPAEGAAFVVGARGDGGDGGPVVVPPVSVHAAAAAYALWTSVPTRAETLPMTIPAASPPVGDERETDGGVLQVLEDDIEDLAGHGIIEDELLPRRARSGVTLAVLLAGVGVMVAAAVGALLALVGVALRHAAGVG